MADRSNSALHANLTREIHRGPAGPKVAAFFDVDRTLLSGFSAAAFVREQLFSGRIGPNELAEMTLGALGFALGRSGFSGFVTSATASYRGLPESALEEIGEKIFVKRLASMVYPEARALVRAHRERGHTVAIVSSALRYQVEPLARDLDIEHVLCTRLEVEEGVFTGRVLKPTCFGEGKAQAVRDLAEKLGLDLEESWFYTDSHDDLPALEVVGRPRPLNPDDRLERVARERGWPVRRFTSRGTPGAAELLRTLSVYGSLLPAGLAGLAAGVANQSRREGVNLFGSFWADLALSLAGVHVQVSGEEHLWSHRPAVFLFNHQSALDMPIMIKLVRRDMTGVGKAELRWNPIFGPLLWLAGVAFVDRADSKKAIDALAPAVDALRRGTSLVIAPEGTRSPTPRLGRFKKGAFHMAMQAGVPVVPVVIRNAGDALPKNGVVVRPATIEVVVLPPVETSDWTRETLDDEIDAIRARYQEVLEG
jgi:putative phosphoserine phosphatase / 1-acylglycerol-3-phosphate O-acyltransferase